MLTRQMETEREPVADERRTLAGVDEAGLGPILGPLVVGGAALSGPEGGDPWALLGELICRQRQEKGKIRVADSKKVNQGKFGFERLERAALVFWAVLHGDLPATLEDWLVAMGTEIAPLRACPWYRDLDRPIPEASERDDVLLRAAILGRQMERKGLELLDLYARPVDVDEFNALIAETDNKSHTHFAAYAEVIARLLGRLDAGGHLVADRAGGRTHYRTALQRHCRGYDVRTIRETPAASSYELHRPNGDEIRVTFASQGEDRAFPTALASCAAKYLRELMVRVLNDWFRERIPDLKPTAGYYVDGHRFLADIEPHLDRLDIPLSRLVRVR